MEYGETTAEIWKKRFIIGNNVTIYRDIENTRKQTQHV